MGAIQTRRPNDQPGDFGAATHPAPHILCRHAADPEDAIIRAVNASKENDIIAAIVGAVDGALYGKVGLPHRWVEGLLGRTEEGDDGVSLS